MLNTGVIVKRNLQTPKMAHVVLFSSDLTLGDAQLIDYYRLRFQLECNVRDAKQYWGLEDFMSVNDLKAWFRGRKYVVETLKLLPEMPDSLFIAQVVSQVAKLGRVNHAVNPS